MTKANLYQSPTAGGSALPSGSVVGLPGQPHCPFCDAPQPGDRCASCGRDPTAPRRKCGACARMTPTLEPACCRCGRVARSDLWWKVPLIVVLFVVVIALSILLQLLG
jgi:hypothetical protein